MLTNFQISSRSPHHGWISFAAIRIILMRLGFGRKGISRGLSITFVTHPFSAASPNYEATSLADSLMAIFQSYMYGAFTPAYGVFATLTSVTPRIVGHSFCCDCCNSGRSNCWADWDRKVMIGNKKLMSTMCMFKGHFPCNITIGFKVVCYG